MKLKEIKPGMAIHCKTIEEAKTLIELTKSEYEFLRSWEDEEEKTCYRMDNGKIDGFSSTFYYKENGYEIVEFSDLIIPELTLEEVLQICTEICEGRECDDCPMRGGDCFKNPDSDKSEIVKICEQWKSDHEKKEPEVEWYWQGRIFKVDENGCYYQVKNGTGFYDTGCVYRENAEEFMANVLKEYCKTHEGNYIATVEHICRVKEEE